MAGFPNNFLVPKEGSDQAQERLAQREYGTDILPLVHSEALRHMGQHFMGPEGEGRVCHTHSGSSH